MGNQRLSKKAINRIIFFAIYLKQKKKNNLVIKYKI